MKSGSQKKYLGGKLRLKDAPAEDVHSKSRALISPLPPSAKKLKPET
jgi:hypothetical protein